MLLKVGKMFKNLIRSGINISSILLQNQARILLCRVA